MPDSDRDLRESVERSRHGAPAVGAVVRDRFESNEVFQRIIAAADDEIDTGFRELFFSSLAAGFAITLTVLVYATMYAKYDGDTILSGFMYPIGFIYIILGGYQLYTENTLPPVALVLERLASLPALFRVWVIVLVGNFVGGTVGALVLSQTGVFSDDAAVAATEIAMKGMETPFADLFFKGAFAGLIVAGVVWLDFASRDTITRFFLVYMAFLMIPFADLFHVVVSFTEVMFLVFNGRIDLFVGLSEFVLPVMLGNTIGGVLLVTVVNYFQTTERRLEAARQDGAERQLTIREWLIGGPVGRAYVPAMPASGPDLTADTPERDAGAHSEQSDDETGPAGREPDRTEAAGDRPTDELEYPKDE